MSRTTAMRFLVLVTALLTLSACDSAGSGPDPQEPAAPPGSAVALVVPIDTVTANEGGPSAAVALRRHFRGGPTAGALRFSLAQAPSPSAPDVFLRGDTLYVRPSRPGWGHVVVTAEGSNGGQATAEIVVQAQGRCPSPIPTGRVALFPEPLSVGTTWTYALHESGSSAVSAPYRTNGSVLLRIVGVGTCWSGAQPFQIEQAMTASTEIQNGSTGEWGPPQPTTSTTTYEWIFNDDRVTTTAPGFSGPRGLIDPPPFGRSVPRHIAPSELSSGVLRLIGGTFLPTVTLRQQMGPTSFTVSSYYSTVTKHVGWTLGPS